MATELDATTSICISTFISCTDQQAQQMDTGRLQEHKQAFRSKGSTCACAVLHEESTPMYTDRFVTGMGVLDLHCLYGCLTSELKWRAIKTG
jgi:hypothetical protein